MDNRRPAPLMVARNCKCCGTPFEARAVDVRRGWGKFCTKSCKATYQERRTGQHRRHLRRVLITDANDGRSPADLQRAYGGEPAFDAHGQYVGFTLGGER